MVQAQRDRRLGPRDYYQMLTTFLMAVLGVMAVIRAVSLHFLPPLLVLGLAMTGYAIYRAKMIVNSLTGRGSER